MSLCIHGEGIGNVHLTLTCDVRGCTTTQTFTQDNYTIPDFLRREPQAAS
jgi:hypothetical protein